MKKTERRFAGKAEARAGEKRAAGSGWLAARRGAGYGERAEFVYDGAKAGGRVGGGMAGSAARREAGYGERAEFVYDGAKVGVSSARR